MATFPYNISTIPQWNGAGNPIGGGAPVTTFDKGYGVKAAQLSYVDRSRGVNIRQSTYGQANGTLCNGQYKWPIFVTDLNIDLSVSGSIGQSRYTRDFYPKNFVQPAFQIQGQGIDEQDYGMMCDFVHMSQRQMLTPNIVWGNGSSPQITSSNLMQLQIAQRGFIGNNATTRKGVRITPHTTGPRVTVTLNGKTTTLFNQSMRGAHMEILCLGFVTTMPRQHQTGVPAPTWSFGFQVIQMIQGPYAEGPPNSPSSAAATWVDLLRSGTTISSDDNSLVAQNKQVLDWAQQHSVNVIASTAGDGSGSPGGGSSGGSGSGAGSGATGNGTLAAAVSLGQRAAALESSSHCYGYTQGSGRTNSGNGVLSPPYTFDCSGFCGAVYKYAGLADPYGNTGYAGVSGDVNSAGVCHQVSEGAAVPGDLVTFPQGGGDHVALYIGNGQVVNMGGANEPDIASLQGEIDSHGGFGGYWHLPGAN